MELPVLIQQSLADKVAAVSLRDARQVGAHHRLRMVFLSDDEGKLQAICRCDDLLDLNALNQQLGREFRMMPLAEQVRLRQKIGLSDLPALPALTGWPTVIDAQVDALDYVALPLEDHELVAVLSPADFADLTGSARRAHFAVETGTISVNHDEPSGDRQQLHNAIERFTSLRIRQRLEDTLELPPLPETAQRIIHLRVNPNAVMGDLVDIVESDPSLAAQVVSWASSSFYAAAGQVRSVYDAVSRVLGFDLVMNLAMGLSLGRALKAPTDHPDGYADYWQQAIWQAQAAGILAGMMRGPERPVFGLAYLAGLLHNFGYLVLGHVFPPHFRLVCRSLEINPDIDSSMIEQHLLGVTREQVAAELMASWGMPEEVIQALRHQKNAGYEGRHHRYARLLWLGRQLLTQRGVALGAGEVPVNADFESLGLDRAKVEARFDELVARKDSVMAIAGMMNQGV